MKEGSELVAARRLHELGRHRECLEALGIGAEPAPEVGAEALDLAGEAGHRLGRLEQAARFLEMAAERSPGGRIERLCRAAQVVARLGGGPALTRLRERVEGLLETSRDPRDRGHFLGVLALEQASRGLSTEALESLAGARKQLAGVEDPRLEAWIAHREAYLERRQGRFDAAEKLCRATLDGLADCPGQPLLAAAQRLLATLHLARLEPLEALQPLARSLHLFRAAGDRLGEADAMRTTGVVQRKLGRLPESIQLLEGARAVYHDLGLASRESRTHSEIGHTLLAAGDLAGAVGAYRRDLALLEGFGDEERWVRARAHVCRRLGRGELLAVGLLPARMRPGLTASPPPPQAEEWLEKSRRLAMQGGDAVSAARASLELAWVHWIRKDRGAVEASVARAAASVDARSVPAAHEAIAARLEARLALPADEAGARRRLESALARVAGPVPSMLGLELRLDLADLEEITGRRDAALDQYRHAYEDARALSAASLSSLILERLVALSPDELIASSLDARAPAESVAAEAPPIPGLAGRSAPLAEVRRRLRRAAHREIPVLITGETGAGKGVIARAIHQLSARRRGPFHALNMAAISETLADSELFGHREGSFTGATSGRRGAFRVAAGGTLFLDEIGDLSLTCQAKLLHALDEGRIQPVGEDLPVAVDVRLIFATHQDLEQMVEEKKFRRDLLERMRRYVIHVPPLRERPGDVEDLVEDFESRHGKLDLDAGAIECLKSQPWPGNVRQLLNVLQSALVDREPGRPVRREDLAVLLGSPRPAAPPALRPDLPRSPPAPDLEALIEDCRTTGENVMEEIERRVFDAALTLTAGNVSEAARLLGVHRNTLMRHRKRQDPR